MKKLGILGIAVATLASPLSAFAAASYAQQAATEWSDKPYGATYYKKDGTKIFISPGPGINARMREVEAMLKTNKLLSMLHLLRYSINLPVSFKDRLVRL